MIMKIRSIELTNFKKFVGTVRVDAICDNVNVLVGRNELGKSTLLQAINAVIFDKARSTASHVKTFRHFFNGTVPEVKLTFDIRDKKWTIGKRFAGQAGKALLQCSDGRIFEDDAAEVELQRLLGFAGGRGGGEPGIWGTLWVQQGKSFGDNELDETARRTIQGCLEAQIGQVTGGTRGQKIPKAVRVALDDLRNQRGPRGKYKETLERLNRVRATAMLSSEFNQHEATLLRAATLEAEATRLSEVLGAVSATDDAVARIEEAATERAAAEAAANAVATTITFAVEDHARRRISIDGKLLGDLPETIPLLGKAVIAIEDMGTIAVEPQIKDRAALLERQQRAAREWIASLEAAGVTDLPAARLASAQRKEHARNLAAVRKELSNLAPGNRQKRIADGLDALKERVGELRGRFRSEMEKLALTILPDADALEAEVVKNNEKGARLEEEVALAEAALAGPNAIFARADEDSRDIEGRRAGLHSSCMYSSSRLMLAAVPGRTVLTCLSR
jgi:recombinational DNA repair ATPase RecF